MTASSQSFQSVRRLIRQGDLTAATGVAQGLNGFESLLARGLLAVEENQEQALVLSEQALAHSRLDVDEEHTAWALWLNGRAQAAFGDIESAVLSMQRAHRLFGDANRVVYALESQCWCASFVELMGDARQAVAMYESVMGALELHDEPWARGLMLLTQGHYFRLKGLLSIAEDHYEQARAFFQSQGWHLLAQESLFGLCQSSAYRGDHAASLNVLMQVSKQLKAFGAKYRMGPVRAQQARILFFRGQWSALNRFAEKVSQRASPLDQTSNLYIEFWGIQHALADSPSRIAALEDLKIRAGERHLKDLSLYCCLALVYEFARQENWSELDYNMQRAVSLLQQTGLRDSAIAHFAEIAASWLGTQQHKVGIRRSIRLFQLAIDQWSVLKQTQGADRIESELLGLQADGHAPAIGQYDLIRQLSVGPFGESWLAQSYRTKERVLLRIMNGKRIPRKRAASIIIERVRTLSKIRHSSIVSVYGYEETDYATEVMTGRRIRQGTIVMVTHWLGHESWPGPKSWSDLNAAVKGVLNGLTVLHGRGHLHLSLHPTCVWVRNRQGVKQFCIADFVLLDTLRMLLGKKTVKHFSSYLAPEQVRDERDFIGEWTDIYSLGNVVYFWLTGAPYAGGLIDETFQFDCPVGVMDWLIRCLKEDVEDRFPDAEHALQAWWSLGEATGQEVSEADHTFEIENMTGWTADFSGDHDTDDEDLTRELPSSGGSEQDCTVALDRGDSESSLITDKIDDITLIGKGIEGANDDTDTLEWVVTTNPDAPDHDTAVLPDWDVLRPVRDTYLSGEEGLSRFGLVDPPMIGRTEIQDGLWRALERAAVHRDPQCVVVEGTHDLGNARLMNWFQECVESWGGGDVILARCDQHSSPMTAMAHALAVRLRCLGLRQRQIYARLSKRFPSLSGVIRNALSSLLCELHDGDDTSISLPNQPLTILESAFAHMAERRALVLILENYESDPVVDAVLRRLMSSSLRFTLVLSRERAPTGQRANPFESAVHYTLAPLSLSEQAVFIRHALNVRPDLAHRLATMTRGVPQLAYQVLADLFDQNAWVVEGEFVNLRQGTRLEFPDDLMGLWRKRLSTVLDQLSVPHVQALFLGAAWGHRVNTSIWLKVCVTLGIHNPERVLHFVAEKNLIRLEPEFWVFEEPLMRQACLDRARELGELPGYHRSISETIAEMTDVDDARKAQHLFGGGVHSEACPKLLELMRVYLATGRFGMANETMEHIQTCVERLSLPPSDPWVGHARLFELQLNFNSKEASEFIEPMQAFLQTAKTNQWDELYMMGLVRLGQALRWSGQHEEATRVYKKVLPLAEGLGNYPEVTAISYGLAALSRSKGEFKTAQKHLARGIANQVKHPHLPINLYCLLSMGAVKSGLQEYDNAQMWFERAAEQATRMGYPRQYSEALIGQGEIYKNQGQLALAEKKYQEALSVLPASAKGRSGLIELNLCAVLMAKGEFARCRERLEKARRDVEKLKTKSASLVLDILMTPDVITRLSDKAWADWMHGIEKRLAQTHYADPDVGLAFELSATQAESKGFIERSRSVLAQAEQQWTQLGRPKRIQAVQKWRKLLGP